MSKAFANGPGGSGFNLGLCHKKMVLDSALLNTQHKKVSIRGKVEQSREKVAPSPTP